MHCCELIPDDVNGNSHVVHVCYGKCAKGVLSFNQKSLPSFNFLLVLRLTLRVGEAYSFHLKRESRAGQKQHGI